MNVFGLMQLCETAGTVGGYGDYFDIEQRVRHGELRSPSELVGFVETALGAAIGPADGVASGIAFRAARHGVIGEIPEVCAALSSERVPLEMRLASVQMGQRLWLVSRTWGWAQCVHEQFDEMARRSDLHHAVAFGALVSETTSSQIRAIATYLFNTAKTIVNAAVRAIPLDDTEGQQVLSRVQPTIAQLAAAYADKGPHDIGAPGWKPV